MSQMCISVIIGLCTSYVAATDKERSTSAPMTKTF